MLKFLELIRYKNLILVTLTMMSVRAFYLQKFLNENNKTSLLEITNFSLLVLSLVLITAAGNIINDYFDVKADRINKPDKVIITKYIKKRWAIALHWTFNAIAFIIGIYLSFVLNNLTILFIQFIAINLLWFYSMYFKRKAGVGNLVVSSLIASVPIISYIYLVQVGIIYNLSIDRIYVNMNINESILFWNNVFLQEKTYLVILVFFAFTLNLSREIIKDILDIEGDKLIYAKTIPHIIGVKNSANISAIILVTAPILFIGIFYNFSQGNFINHAIALLPIITSLVLNLISILLILSSTKRNNMIWSEILIKISMVLGILLPYYWSLFNL